VWSNIQIQIKVKLLIFEMEQTKSSVYNMIQDIRLNKAISTNYGKILELDLAKVPAN
jgi:methionyl-tRNA formyltransferase